MKRWRFFITVLMIQLELTFSLRTSFFVKVGAIILKQGLFLVMWGFFFNKYNSINGWHFEEMLAMLGLTVFSIGVVELLFYGVRDLSAIVDNNQLDHYLTQPKGVLINVALSKGDISAISEIIYGLILLIISGYLISELLFLLLILPLGVLFIFSLYLYLGSISFYMKNSQGFVHDLIQNANTVATQPNCAYHGFFKIFTMTILPTTYLSFFPIEFLRGHMIYNLLYAYGGTLLFFFLAYTFFYQGLKRYESGNSISQKY